MIILLCHSRRQKCTLTLVETIKWQNSFCLIVHFVSFCTVVVIDSLFISLHSYFESKLYVNIKINQKELDKNLTNYRQCRNVVIVNYWGYNDGAVKIWYFYSPTVNTNHAISSDIMACLLKQENFLFPLLSQWFEKIFWYHIIKNIHFFFNKRKRCRSYCGTNARFI